MTNQQRNELEQFLTKGLYEYFSSLSIEELRCIDWLSVNADYWRHKYKGIPIGNKVLRNS